MSLVCALGGGFVRTDSARCLLPPCSARRALCFLSRLALFRWALSLWHPACCSACWRLPATRSRGRTPHFWAQFWSTNHFFLDFAPPGFSWSNWPAVTTHQVLSAHSSMGPRNFIRLDGLFRRFRPMLRVLRCKIQTLSSASGLRNPPGSSWSNAAPDSFRRSPRQMELLEFNFCNFVHLRLSATTQHWAFSPIQISQPALSAPRLTGAPMNLVGIIRRL